MKSLFLFIVTLFVLTSCGESKSETEFHNLQKEANVHMNDMPGPDFDYSNPTVFMGSDFGNFFKILYAQGKFDEMIKFTSKASIDKFGKDKVLDFYKNDLKFGYEIGKPHSQTVSGDTITLNYDANIIATKRVVRINVVIENDSCKIVLPDNLKNFPS